MIIIPPRHFVVIDNPVLKNKDGNLEHDEYGQIKLRHGDSEVRFHQEPFALYPGERISGAIQPLHVVPENSALRLRAKRDFVDRYATDSAGKPIKRRAGEEWIFPGLATYLPQSEEEVLVHMKAWIIKPNQALKLKAKENCIDYQGKPRKAGEQWLVRREGAYLPGVNETDEELVDAIVLTPKMAIHVRAKISFTDANGIERKSGEEWLVTREEHETYIPDVNEEVTARVPLTVLNHRQYCVIADPIGENGKPQLGSLEYRRGPSNFFLRPGESFNTNISYAFVLSPEKALWMRAKESFVDHKGVKRNPGDTWLVYGPGEYWPPVEAEHLRSISAFLAFEPLGLYFFQPVPFAVVSFILFVIFLLVLRGFRASTKQEL